jgi:16S rRNA (cytosine1402-N4)-methyltransferase
MGTATHRVVGSLARSANLSYVPTEHEPVLAEELVDVLDPRPGETFVDCTFGGGGHARLIAERLGPDGELIAVDRDPASEERWREFAAELPCRARFLRADFVAALEGLRGEGVRPNGIVFDLGMSSMQVDAWERGFSYSYDAPLDMRMDPTQGLSAATVVNEWPQDRLARAIRELGEERRAGSIAREIVKRRPIETTAQLVTAIKAAIPPSERFGRGHPAKRTFQAVRIAVNGELEALDRALPLAWDVLIVGGRLGAISFHSLEDRRVKRFLADRARGCVCPPEFPVCVCGREPEAELITKRAISPGPEELERNPRAGSAHLRAALKIREEEQAGWRLQPQGAPRRPPGPRAASRAAHAALPRPRRGPDRRRRAGSCLI